MSRRSLPLLALVATLGAPGIVGCSGEEAPVLPKFRVGTAAWAGFSPLNVAEAKGFFDAEGIDVEVVPFEEGAGSTALQAGTIDANLDVLGVFVNRTMVGKDDLKILAELDWSYGGDEVILRPPVDTSVAAIRAKTKSVGVYSKTASNLLLLDYYLKDTSRHADWGLAIDRVSVVERLPEELVTSFAAGEDALSLNYQPISTEQVRAGGEVVATSATYPGVISEGLAVNAARYAGANKALYTKFFKGWIRGVEYMYGRDATRSILDASHADEVVQIVQQQTYENDGSTADEVRAYLGSVRHHNLAKLEKINFDARETVLLADYSTLGVQPLRSHLSEIAAFVKRTTPDAAPFDVAQRTDVAPLKAAVDALKARPE
jgi:NitT/TauT family transport system substrate-binding protein